MIALQTIFVYSFLTLVFYSLCKEASAKNKWSYVMVALLVYTFVFAIRYGVGRDYVNYLTVYKDALTGVYNEHSEVGFVWLQRFLAAFNCHPIIFFGLVAFLQIFLVFRSFKDEKYILPYMALTFMLGCYWLNFSSALRQILAFSLFVYSIAFAEKRKWLPYYILNALAVSVHSSAIILVIVYPLYQLIANLRINNNFIKIGVLIVAAILGNTPFLSDYLELLDKVLLIGGYEKYSNEAYQKYLIAEEIATWGVGAFILLAQNIVIITNQNSLREHFKSRKVNFLCSIYYIGTIGNYLFTASGIFSRLFGYFYWLQFIICAYVLFMARQTNRQKLYYLLLCLYFLTFVANLYRMFDNNTAFYFYWQSSMFNMPD